MELSLFERAAIRKVRFDSTQGQLTVEQLFDVPLTSRNGFNLDAIAHTVNGELQEVSKGSFVRSDDFSSRRVSRLQDKLDVVKRVIEYKQHMRDAAARQMQLDQRRREIESALAERQRKDLTDKDASELEEELKKIHAETGTVFED